ncbi:MAG: DDE-type integrase/transposase/recombinase [Paracoccaceae bacterium]
MRQASETVRCYQPMTIVTDKAQSYAKVIEEMNFDIGPDDRIRHVDRKYLNNRIEADHAALKQLLRPKRDFRKMGEQHLDLLSSSSGALISFRLGNCADLLAERFVR